MKKPWYRFWKTRLEKYDEAHKIGFTTATFILNKNTQESTNFVKLFNKFDKGAPEEDGMRSAIKIWRETSKKEEDMAHEFNHPIIGQEAICSRGLGRVINFKDDFPEQWIQVSTYVKDYQSKYDPCNVKLLKVAELSETQP